jgi:hypothetical protein
MLAALAAVRATPSTLLDTVRRLGGVDPAQQSVLLRTLMWGVKHGLLECSVRPTGDRHGLPSNDAVTLGER